jgi:hypothetical protein
MEIQNFENKKFNSPEEEISFLREYIAGKEKDIESQPKSPEQINPNQENLDNKEQAIKQTLEEYSKQTPEDVMEKGTAVPEKFREEIVLKLSPEDHDQKMAELISLVQEKGIINALDIVNRMENAHINDDFHRFLVQYLKSGYPINDLKEDTPLERSLRRTLFEVTLTYDKNAEKPDLQSFIALMEQFYSGMISVTDDDKDEYISLEIANPIGSKHFIFYISVPDDKSNLLEKQILSVFPNATITVQNNDFNVFNNEGYSAGAYVKQKNTPAQIIKTYDQFSNDPVNILLNVFSKLEEHSEAACIQLVFKPAGDFYLKKYKKAISKMESGEKKPDELYVRNTAMSKFGLSVSNLISGKPNKEGENKTDSEMMENVQAKISSPIVSTNWRLVVSGSDQGRVDSILNDIQSAFNQFENTKGNKFEIVDIEEKQKKKFFKKFSFRSFDPNYDSPMNLKEISTVMHLPSEGSKSSPELKTNKMKTAPAPLTIATEGLHLGTNVHRGTETEIYYTPEDRLRHFYVIGQTGTGKTNILKQMIIQDIKNGEGVCFIDPHGSDVQDILANIPEERYDDLIYFDPSHIERPLGLNMLEYNYEKPEQKTFVVNELFNIFKKLYSGSPESMGPMFEQYFRNATMLVIEDPESGSTLLDVSRVLADKKFRDMKLSRCKNPVVNQFWNEIATKAGGEASLENIVPYITSKFDVFLANDVMRPIIAQQKSSFNFRDIMDDRKILLVNLSKGSLGDINSNLIGLILVGKILMASLSRSDVADKSYPPFYLYIDEFQNVTTDSISTILSEARKYKLSLNVAHQFIAQLDESIRDSIFGNVGSMAVFRVGTEDAQFLESQFSPTFNSSDIINIDNYNAYVRMLSGGVPVDPFSLRAPKSPDGDPNKIESLKKLSHLKHGRARAEVEKEINDRYSIGPEAPNPTPQEQGAADLSDLL